ncbi:transcriptional regulator, TetR family [Myxococcus fulvus]|uniref:Transcriptional regulator, TetR family n=1 Tax=Myxococcus fulvus TaxID=33 RepID=A0ABY1CAX8_MYXFU|nr:TetR/AcrR family transcriptional regulator [Myxococcus fulvus]SET87654.1 transcriptional regulator, TetR family [Myxococcus fulvus]
MDTKTPARPAAEDARRHRLLDAALGVFLRYGFRKTSMDEVARAADISRQGLYLHFATKEELFQATLRHAMEGSLQRAREGLSDESLSVEARLVRGFDAWMGHFVGSVGAGASDLNEVVNGTAAREVVVQHEALFVEAVTKVVRASGLVAAYKPAGLSARQLVDTLNATARGLKHSGDTRDAFVDGLTIAVRALCMPLGAAR